MKRFIIFTSILGLVHSCSGQTAGEWFRQKKTQTKYLIQQIAALEVYAGNAKKGYDIARTGLRTIGNIKKGDLNLHSDHFSSLKNVNPTVKSYSKVLQIIRLQLQMLSQYNQTRKLMHESNQFGTGEMKYYSRIFSDLFSQNTGIIDQLIMVTTSGELEMKDDERITRIDALYADMLDRHAFMQSFSADARLLALQRQKEQDDIKTSSAIYGVK